MPSRGEQGAPLRMEQSLVITVFQHCLVLDLSLQPQWGVAASPAPMSTWYHIPRSPN